MKIINRRIISILIGVIFGCLLMFFIESIFTPTYIIKSFLKILIFGSIPVIYSIVLKDNSLINILKIKNKRSFLLYSLFGLAIFVSILLGYYFLKDFFDLNNIAKNLRNNGNITKENFIFVAIYISIFNSFLEELFFRGFSFLMLKGKIGIISSCIFSALAFALYHISIMSQWFSPLLFILLILGLFIVGLFFNYINEKSENIYNSWMIHLFANLAINTIGLAMFNII